LGGAGGEATLPGFGVSPMLLFLPFGASAGEEKELVRGYPAPQQRARCPLQSRLQSASPQNLYLKGCGTPHTYINVSWATSL